MDIKIRKICGKSMRKTLLKKIAYIVNKHKWKIMNLILAIVFKIVLYSWSGGTFIYSFVRL